MTGHLLRTTEWQHVDGNMLPLECDFVDVPKRYIRRLEKEDERYDQMKLGVRTSASSRLTRFNPLGGDYPKPPALPGSSGMCVAATGFPAST